MKIYSFLIIAFIILFAVSCKKKSPNGKASLIQTKDSIVNTDTEVNSMHIDSPQAVVMYARSPEDNGDCEVMKKFKLPDIKDIFSNISALPADFSFLYPVEYLEKCTKVEEQAKLLGIYSADMSYSLAFNNLQKFVEYYKAIYSLVNSLGLSNVVSEEEIKKSTSITDSDSLAIIMSKTIKNICRSFEQSSMTDIMPFVIYSGWLESNYLIVSYLLKVKKTDFLFKKLKEQYQSIENLSDYMNDALASMNSYQESKRLQGLINHLSELDTLYNEIYQQTDLIISDDQLKTISDTLLVYRQSLLKYE